MKNKKNIAMAMTAVSTLGAVAPVFANEVQTRAIENNTEIDVRKASGYTICTVDGAVKVYTRAEIFNYNGDSTDRDKHTLKSDFKNHVILVQQNGTLPSSDKFILATKNENTAEVKAEAAALESVKEEIKAYIADGYTFKQTDNKATITTTANGTTYKEGNTVVELTKEKKTIKITFKNVDDLKVVDKTDEELTNALRTKVFGKFKDTDFIVFDGGKTSKTYNLDVEKYDLEEMTDNEKKVYNQVNKLKYAIESNIKSFDVVKDEAGTTNKDLKVTLFRKGSDQTKEENKVLTLIFENVDDVESELIMNISQTTDFTGHWAKSKIVDAMLEGHIDASNNFRPQDGITRAEFAKMACTIFNITATDTDSEPFEDVTKNDWYYEYVVALYNKKFGNVSIISKAENFRPNDKITRQEVAVILAKLVKEDAVETTKTVTVNGKKVIIDEFGTDKANFKDVKDIANWADESVQYLSTITYKEDTTSEPKAVAQGSEGYFNPTKDITRAEALVMVQRSLLANKQK